jgi:hypothetical protein
MILLGLILDDNAFLAPNLRSAEDLGKLYIPPGLNQLPLPLDPRLDDIPVFRNVNSTAGGFVISDTEPLTYGAMYWSLKVLGQLIGFLLILRSYALRYGAGKAFNENGMYFIFYPV